MGSRSSRLLIGKALLRSEARSTARLHFRCVRVVAAAVVTAGTHADNYRAGPLCHVRIQVALCRDWLPHLTRTLRWTAAEDGLGNSAHPLSALGSPTARFTWTAAAQASFDALKQALSSAPALRLFDPLTIDARNLAVAAVLMTRATPL